MSNDTINQIKIFGETRYFKDSWSREKIERRDSKGHKIADNHEVYPSRRKLQFMSSDVIDDESNNTTVVNFNVPKIVQKPEVIIEEYTYNGESQGPEVTGITEDMTIQNMSKVNAGTYTLIISLSNSAYTWADGTTSDLSYTYTINKLLFKKPTDGQSSPTFDYDGNQHFPELHDYISEYMELGEDDEPKINPGNYVTTIDLKDKENTAWYDNTTTVLRYLWIIDKIESIINFDPSDTIYLTPGNLYQDVIISYNGDRGSELNFSYSESLVNPDIISHETSVTFELIETYMESNITYKKYRFTATKNEIAVFEFVALSDSYYKRKLIRFTVNSKVIKSLNNSTWEEISNASNNGKASTYWSIGDKKEIILNGNIGNNLIINNEKYYVYIIGFDHNKDIEGSGISFGCFIVKRPDGYEYQYANSDSYYNNFGLEGNKNFNINHWKSSSPEGYLTLGGWAACDMRYDILGSTNIQPDHYGEGRQENDSGYNPTLECTTNPVANTLMSALPQDLRQVLKPILKYTDNGDTYLSDDATKLYESVTGYYDYLPLMSFYELYGNKANEYFNPYEHDKQQQYDYYKNGNGMKKYTLNINNNSFELTKYWLRSKAIQNRSDLPIWWYYYDSGNAGGTISGTQARLSYALSPVFLV